MTHALAIQHLAALNTLAMLYTKQVESGAPELSNIEMVKVLNTQRDQPMPITTQELAVHVYRALLDADAAELGEFDAALNPTRPDFLASLTEEAPVAVGTSFSAAAAQPDRDDPEHRFELLRLWYAANKEMTGLRKRVLVDGGISPFAFNLWVDEANANHLNDSDRSEIRLAATALGYEPAPKLHTFRLNIERARRVLSDTFQGTDARLDIAKRCVTTFADYSRYLSHGKTDHLSDQTLRCLVREAATLGMREPDAKLSKETYAQYLRRAETTLLASLTSPYRLSVAAEYIGFDSDALITYLQDPDNLPLTPSLEARLIEAAKLAGFTEEPQPPHVEDLDDESHRFELLRQWFNATNIVLEERGRVCAAAGVSRFAFAQWLLEGDGNKWMDAKDIVGIFAAAAELYYRPAPKLDNTLMNLARARQYFIDRLPNPSDRRIPYSRVRAPHAVLRRFEDYGAIDQLSDLNKRHILREAATLGMREAVGK